MKSYISFSTFDLKYTMYCISFIILNIFLYLFIFNDDSDENIINNHQLLVSSCIFLGFLLNFIPSLISNIKSNNNEYLSIKEIIKIFFLCIIFLIILFFRIIQQIINQNNDEKDYENRFIFIELLLIFLNPCSSEVNYKHQKFSFLIFTLIEIIKIIVFILYKSSNNYSAIFNEIIISIFYAFYYIYIKRLMKYKYISPYTCNFVVGIINFPIVIIIYFIISFTSLGDDKSKYYVDNIFNLFKYNLNIINIMRLISLPIAYGISYSLLYKIIYDYTLYHAFIPLLIENFIGDMINLQIKSGIIFLISCFLIEFIMILIFTEIVELNFCELNKNLKKNIESRALIESSLENEENYKDEVDQEKKDINN